MEISPLERKVLCLIAEGIPECPELKAQVEAASVSSRDYTGCGVYTKFALPVTTPLFEPGRWRIEDMPKIEGVHPDVPAGVGFILWFKAGLITCLEGYTYDGNWPTNEEQFTLHA